MTNDTNPSPIDPRGGRVLSVTLNRSGKWLLAAVALFVAAIGYGAGVSDRPEPVVLTNETVVDRPAGCEAEDDYRNLNGDCVHVDVIVDQAIRDRCRTEDSCRVDYVDGRWTVTPTVP